MPAEQRTPHSGTIPPAVTTLASQVGQALCDNRWPAIWSPQFTAAWRLLGVVLRVRLALARRLEGALQALTGIPGAELSQLLTKVSTELYNALAFAGNHPIRRREPLSPPGGISPSEIFHLAHVALTLPGEEAVRRVRRHAILWVTWRVAYGELQRREARLGPGLTPAHYVMALAMEIVPEIHGQALTTLMRLAGFGADPRHGRPLEEYAPQSLRGGYAKDVPPGVTHLWRKDPEVRGELTHAILELLANLREGGPDVILGMALDGDKEVTHLPHAAAMDCQNRWEQMRLDEEREESIPDKAENERGSLAALAENIRQILGPPDPDKGIRRRSKDRDDPLGVQQDVPAPLIPGVGWDPTIRRAEEIRDTLDQSATPEERLEGNRGILTKFLEQPPAVFVEELTAAERNAFDALRRLHADGQLFAVWGFQTQLAKTADVSVPTVSRMMEKLRKALSQPI